MYSGLPVPGMWIRAYLLLMKEVLTVLHKLPISSVFSILLQTYLGTTILTLWSSLMVD